MALNGPPSVRLGGSYRGKTGHASLWWARRFMTLSDTLRPPIDALRNAYSITSSAIDTRAGLQLDPCDEHHGYPAARGDDQGVTKP